MIFDFCKVKNQGEEAEVSVTEVCTVMKNKNGSIPLIKFVLIVFGSERIKKIFNETNNKFNYFCNPNKLYQKNEFETFKTVSFLN